VNQGIRSITLPREGVPVNGVVRKKQERSHSDKMCHFHVHNLLKKHIKNHLVRSPVILWRFPGSERLETRQPTAWFAIRLARPRAHDVDGRPGFAVLDIIECAMMEATGFAQFGRGLALRIKACALDAHEGHAVRTDCVDSRDADFVHGCFDGIMHANSGSFGGLRLIMIVLGISGFENAMAFKKSHWPGLHEREYRISQGHDSAAALVVHGEVVAAAAEERFSRAKHTGSFPEGAVRYCMSAAGITADEIDEIAHGFDYSPYRPIFQMDPISAEQYRQVFSREALLERLSRALPGFPADRFHQVDHHLAHAASASYTSGPDV
jgi:hypothetical protein